MRKKERKEWKIYFSIFPQNLFFTNITRALYPQYTCFMKGANENDTFSFHYGHHFLNRRNYCT